MLVYEGPGQGTVIKNPPYMPFYPEWEDVLLAILNAVEKNLGQYVQLDKISQNGQCLIFCSYLPTSVEQQETVLCVLFSMSFLILPL